jgi:hypothetical protein
MPRLPDDAYYAAEDLRIGNTSAAGCIAVPVAALTVLQSAIQRIRWMPALITDARCITTWAAAARDEIESALQLRPDLRRACGPNWRQTRRWCGQVWRAVRARYRLRNAGPDAQALRISTSGDIRGAMIYFTPANFPTEKQEDTVPAAYIELRLRSLLAMAERKQCAGAVQGIANLEARDTRLPFTARGFASFTSGARFQYLLGVVEFAEWTKCARNVGRRCLMRTRVSHPRLRLPIPGTGEVDPTVGVARSRKALTSKQIGSAAAGVQGTLLYSQGLLQAAIGKRSDALSSLRTGAEAGPAGMVEYLNLEAIRALEAGQ